jgi:hypothetical protein
MAHDRLCARLLLAWAFLPDVQIAVNATIILAKQNQPEPRAR